MKNLVIHDIFPLVDVPDNSLYIFFSLLFLALLSAGLVVHTLYKKFKEHKISREKFALNILRCCDFKKIKQSVYQIAYYAPILAKTDEDKEVLKMILSALSSHKYKKEMPEIPEEIVVQFHLFIDRVGQRYV